MKKKKILLCLCGITPQIITETLYALTIQQTPPFIPNEIHIITTKLGKKIIIEKLLHPMDGRFYQFIKEYNLSGINFREENIYVITQNGYDIDDIKNERDSTIVAKFILKTVKKLCSNPDYIIHASLAGGRKTMSFYLGMAMQFYGKKEDELSHVLVSPPFENHPDFFYPPSTPRNLLIHNPSTKRLELINSSNADINLVKLPFLKLGSQFPKTVSIDSLEEHVKIMQENIENTFSPNIYFYPEKLEIHIEKQIIRLTPLEGAIYFVLIKRKKECNKKVCNINCFDCYTNPYYINIDEIINFLRHKWGDFSSRLTSIEKRLLSKTDLRSWFLQHRSRINRKIQEKNHSGFGKIESKGNYGGKVYGIKANKDAIFIESPKRESN